MYFKKNFSSLKSKLVISIEYFFVYKRAYQKRNPFAPRGRVLLITRWLIHMLIHNLLNITICYKIILICVNIREIVVLELSSNTISNMVSFKGQKWHIKVDQIAVYNGRMPQPFLVLLFIVINRVLYLCLKLLEIKLISILYLLIIRQSQLSNVFCSTVTFKNNYIENFNLFYQPCLDRLTLGI